MTDRLRLACFVTPHGFGHAARACAVLAALDRRLPLAVELFTTVPEWFFADSLALPFVHHPVACDVGLVQHDALREDPVATVAVLDRLLPFAERWLDELAAQVEGARCAAVLCDIAPLGIAVGRRAGLPVALLESFTWDWIYRATLDRAPGLARHAEYLAGWFAAADLHLQAAPACAPSATAVVVGPVARRPRRAAAEVRRELGLRAGERAVLLTMGGIPWDYTGFTPRLPADTVLVIPGAAAAAERRPWAVLLPFHSPLFHPDLVAASDAVVGKLGYSTFAEAWTTGVPFGFIPRAGFPESPVLAAAIEAAGAGRSVPEGALERADWGWLAELLAGERAVGRPGGAEEAAAALAGWLRPPPG